MSPVHVVAPSFELRVTEEGPEGVVMRISGILEGEGCETRIQPELLRLHDALLSAETRNVTLDVCEVEYMSSSALKALAAWFMKAHEAKAYTLRIAYHPAREWQVWSLGALRTLAPGRIRLEPAARMLGAAA
ncbi:MAG TPA: hypothetical protein VK447_06745 [Myxococcaceae bacterium]|nr:hypothetical protein [Myxococcaceae bacterium]